MRGGGNGALVGNKSTKRGRFEYRKQLFLCSAEKLFLAKGAEEAVGRFMVAENDYSVGITPT